MLLQSHAVEPLEGRLEPGPVGRDGKVNSTVAADPDALADLHRGETIAIVATRAMIQDALATIDSPADLVAIDIDASG